MYFHFLFFFRHMWIANIRARNSKNASQASLLRNLWTLYLQVENWQNLTTASFISSAKNDLVFLFRSKKINTIQDIKKTPVFLLFLHTVIVCSRYKWFLSASYASLAVLEIALLSEWNFGCCNICSKFTITEAVKLKKIVF